MRACICCEQDRQRADAASIADLRDKLDRSVETVAILTSERDAARVALHEEKQVRSCVQLHVNPVGL